VAGALAGVLSVAALFGYLQRQGDVYRSQYQMDPEAFREQAAAITEGERVDEVRMRLRGVTRVRETTRSMSLGMDPLSTRTALRQPTTQWIHLTKNKSGLVSGVAASEEQRTWQYLAPRD
jgi:hypothetical protein